MTARQSYATDRERWITNDPEIAKMLRKADSDYELDKIEARFLPLAAKVESLRQAKIRRQAAYDEAAKLARVIP